MLYLSLSEQQNLKKGYFMKNSMLVKVMMVVLTLGAVQSICSESAQAQTPSAPVVKGTTQSSPKTNPSSAKKTVTKKGHKAAKKSGASKNTPKSVQ